MDRTTCIQLDYDKELKGWPIPILDHHYVSLSVLKLKSDDGSWKQVELSKYHISKDNITYITWTDKQNPPSNLYAIISTRKILDNRLIGSLVGSFVAIIVAFIGLYPEANSIEKTSKYLETKASFEALSVRHEALKNDSSNMLESFEKQKTKINSTWKDSIILLNSLWSERLLEATNGSEEEKIIAIKKEFQNCQIDLSKLTKNCLNRELDDIADKELRIRLEYLLGKMFTFQREIEIITKQHNLKTSYGDLFVLIDKLEKPRANDFQKYPNFFASARQARDEIFKVMYSLDENLSLRDNVISNQSESR